MQLGERARRIAEEEIVLVALLAGFAVFFLVAVPPILLVTDSWLTLVGGREVWEHGLPSTDTLTVLGEGRTWTNQQWLAQLVAYGVFSLGGHATLAVAACVAVTAAFVLAAAGARSLGANPLAVGALFFPVLLAAPWGWTIRAQVFALPLFTGLLWLLAAEARRRSRRVYLALPLLVLWGSIHGSATLGALLVMTLAAIEVVATRGRTWKRGALLVVGAPLAILVTPYGPVATARYYHLLLVDPPFGDRVTEWTRTTPGVDTLFFYALVALSLVFVARGWRRLAVFDLAVLAITLANAFLAIRGVLWFSLAALVFVPVAMMGPKRTTPTEAARRLNRMVAVVAVVAVAIAVGYALARDASWYEQDWPDRAIVPLERAVAEPEARVFATSQFADWVLWKLPELRGRIAYDVRFEIYTPETFDRIARFGAERDPDLAIADGFPLLVLEPRGASSRLGHFASTPGAEILYRDDFVALVHRPIGR